MKKFIIVIMAMLCLAEINFAQNVNWRALENDPNLVYLNFGYDFGVTAQFGYGRTLNTSLPILLNLDYSFPMGERLTDDFKVRYGGQIEIVEYNGLSLSAKVYGNFRRYQTEMVRMAGFGAELSALIGYYRQTWHIAGEFGFDKSIVSHLKHSQLLRDNYAEIQDGWYMPMGGHFFYGLQASKTIGSSIDLSLRLGATNAQGKDENALLPYYFQLGLIKRF